MPMKKVILIILSVLLVLGGSLVGYKVIKTQREQKARAEEIHRNYTDTNNLRDYIEENMPAGTMQLLAGNNPYSVNVQSKKASVSFRVLFDFEIPYLAELMIPVAQSFFESSDIQLQSFGVSCYSESNQGGIDSDTFVNWSTYDLKSGTFVSTPDNYHMLDMTVADLKDYYAEDTEIVNRILNEA